jgi:hypothetical protein
MGNLLLEKDLRDSEKDSEVRTLARARTVTVIQRLDSDRTSSVIGFLDEAGLIGKGDSSIHLLAGADLQGAHLQGIDLTVADLSNADLRDADLDGAVLSEADLHNANLSWADVNGAFLQDADLHNASLGRADMRGTWLLGANLEDAGLDRTDLSGAVLHTGGGGKAKSDTNLLNAFPPGADLSDACVATYQLGQGAFTLGIFPGARGATMPDGQTLKGPDNPDGPTFLEWLKGEGIVNKSAGWPDVKTSESGAQLSEWVMSQDGGEVGEYRGCNPV